MLELRRSRSFEEVYRLSALVCERLVETAFFRNAQTVALYASSFNEVLVDGIFEKALGSGKRVCFPRVAKSDGAGLRFYAVEALDELSPGPYSILEPPEKGAVVDLELIDLVLVPGVVFDTEGARIGYGKGYYDRALGHMMCPKVALAFEFQVLEERLPVEPHDVFMDAIVTDRRVIVCNRGLKV